jgi:hypothetical protein
MLNVDHNSRVCPLCNSENDLDAERCCNCNFLFLPDSRASASISEEGVFIDYDLDRRRELKTPSRKDIQKKGGKYN